MAATMTFENIASAVAVHVQSNLSLSPSTTVSYLGEPIDVQSISDWISVTVGSTVRKRQRIVGSDRRTIVVEAFAYAKRGANMYRIDFMVDALTNVFRHAEISVTGGSIRLFEPKIINPTRQFNVPRRTDVQARGLSVVGFVQAT